MLSNHASNWHDAESIARRVWLLTILGVCTICITLATVWVLHSRSRAARSEALNMDAMTSEALSKFSGELAIGRAAFNETLDLRVSKPGDDQWISRLAGGITNYSGRFGSTRVGEEMRRALPAVAEMHSAWDDSVDWFDRRARIADAHSSSKRTIDATLTTLHGCIATSEGQRRLKSISLLNGLRRADAGDPAGIAQQVLHEMQSGAGQSQVRVEIRDLRLLCERLANNSDLDTLSDLKDNQLKPSLERLDAGLRRSIDADDGISEKSRALFVEFESELLGQGFVIDSAHQTIEPGYGGLYPLTVRMLRLSTERSALRARVDRAFARVQDHVRQIDAATDELSRSLGAATESDLAHARSTTILVGLLSGVLLVALGKRIATSVRRQVVDLRQSREEYRSLVESTHAVPWRWNSDARRFVYVGPQAGSLLGCPTEEWLQPGFFDARVHPDDCASSAQRWETLCDHDKDVEIEYRLERNDGTWIWLRSIVSGAVSKESAHVQGFMLDVTERHKMEFELQQAQKLESVGRLAAGVAHEINTPIQFVSDSVHFVRDAVKDLFAVVESLRAVHRSVADGKDSAELLAAAVAAEQAADLVYLEDNVPKALERSLEGLDRVATIVRSMKEFAHPDQREMAPVDLNRAITSTLIIARNEYKYVAEVETDLETLPPVTCHAGDINQAILNVVVNAAHAIAEVVKDSELKGQITVRTRRDRENVLVTIADTGGGIPESIRARVFDPFFTTKEVGKGTGQGLAIAHSVVVDKHGGELTFESVIGKGSTFIIRLPIAGKRPQAAAVAA